MTLKDIADLATSLTLIVAGCTFIYTIWERNSRERRREIQNWQRVVIYGLIEDGATLFHEIQVGYVVAAQQYSETKISKQDIQEATLKLLLLSMIESRLIVISDEGRYLVVRASSSENFVRDMAFGQIQKKMAENTILSQVFQTLESDSGKYGIDQFYRMVKAQEAGFSFEDFDILIRDHINRGAIVAGRDGKLWARNRIPQQAPRKAD